MQRVAVPGTIFDELQTTFAVSASAIVALSAIFLYIYGGMQLIVGMLTDRLGALTVLITGGVLLCGGSFLFPMAHSLPVLYAGRVLVALGASLIYLSIVKCLDAMFSARLFPVLLGITIGIGYTGGLVGTLPFAVLSDRWGWRATLIGVAALTLAALIVTMLMLPRVRMLNQGSVCGVGLGSIGTVLRNLSSLAVIFVGSTNFSVYFLFQATFGKKLLHDVYHLPSATSAMFPFIMTIVAVSCSLTSGMLSRALVHRRKPIVLFATLCMVIGGVLLACSVWCGWSYIWVLVSFCLLGQTSLGSVMTATLMKELNPPEVVGTAIGLSNGACYLVVAVYTSIAGYILDRFSGSATVIHGAVVYPRMAYLVIVGFCIAMLVISFCTACYIKETHGIPSFASDTRQK